MMPNKVKRRRKIQTESGVSTVHFVLLSVVVTMINAVTMVINVYFEIFFHYFCLWSGNVVGNTV